MDAQAPSGAGQNLAYRLRGRRFSNEEPSKWKGTELEGWKSGRMEGWGNRVSDVRLNADVIRGSVFFEQKVTKNTKAGKRDGWEEERMEDWIDGRREEYLYS